MTGAILALNAGSSSLKYALFDADPAQPARLRGEVTEADGALAPLDAILERVDREVGPGGIGAVGHRIVNGGTDHAAPERVTPALIAALTAMAPLDPIHMARNLAPIERIAEVRPACPQVACYDTAFHRTMPAVASTFALPRAITAAGVRRFGFHGLSYEFVAERLAQIDPALARGRVIVAHLGSGASLCALRGGVSIDTTFGLSVLDGLVMATRCGSLDPGVIFHLARQGYSLTEIEDMLYHRSGLLGVSGISGDMRVLLASADPRAAEAIALFIYRIAAEAAAMASALGGLDGIVFTGGIGEHAPQVRAMVCARLGWLGAVIDGAANGAANGAGAASIADPASRIALRVIATDEEAMIARHTRAVLGRP